MKMRITLVVISCLLSVAIGIFLARGKTERLVEEKDQKILVGFSMDTLKEARWQRDRDYFVKGVRDLGADVLVQAANSDDTRQIHDIEALISRGIDVLVIAPHNGIAMAKGVKMAHEAGIPAIAYDRLIMDSDLYLYITFDGFRVGQLQAKYIIDELLPGKEKVRIIRIYGSKMDHNAGCS